MKCCFSWTILGLLASGVGGCGGGPTAVPTLTPTPAVASLPAGAYEPGEPGTWTEARCPFVLPEEFEEGTEVNCGFLSVAEHQPDLATAARGRVLMLAVAIFHPPGGASNPDPVIYLSGGPGSSTLEMLRYATQETLAPVFSTGRDLVFFDQRGVGRSRPALDCPALDALGWELLDDTIDGRAVAPEEAAGLVVASLRECHQELSGVADLTAYNSVASAHDVEALRVALGVDQINLWGGSYGTRLALEVMRQHPQAIRSVVLEAVYPPQVDLIVDSPGNFARALDRLFEACAANAVCNTNYPDLPAVLDETVKRFNEQPVMREVVDPFSGERTSTWMNGDTLLSLTLQLLYDSQLRYLLPQQIHAAHEGSFAAFDLARFSLLRLSNSFSRGMMLSVLCHDELPFSSQDAFERQLAEHPRVAGVLSDSIAGGLAFRVCAEWGAGQADAAANEPVVSDIPTLLLTGEFDPITPPDWGRQAASTLSRSFFFEFPGVGHGAVGRATCPDQMFSAFLEDPAQAPDDACIEGMR